MIRSRKRQSHPEFISGSPSNKERHVYQTDPEIKSGQQQINQPLKIFNNETSMFSQYTKGNDQSASSI